MNITKKINGNQLNIALEGRLDTMTAPEFEKEFKEGIENVKDILVTESSTSKKKTGATFFRNLIDAFKQVMFSDTNYGYYELPDDVAADVVGRDIANPEWDRYAHSILKKLADDIKVYYQGGAVQMVVTKALV